MGRRERQHHREQAQQNWPRLASLLTCYFNQDFDVSFGSVDGAFAAAVDECSLSDRQAILKEWRAWNGHFAGSEIRDFLQDGFGVALYFKQNADAWLFMNRLYQDLLDRVKTETATGE